MWEKRVKWRGIWDMVVRELDVWLVWVDVGEGSVKDKFRVFCRVLFDLVFWERGGWGRRWFEGGYWVCFGYVEFEICVR